jgi:hypothetical protein
MSILKRKRDNNALGKIPTQVEVNVPPNQKAAKTAGKARGTYNVYVI